MLSLFTIPTTKPKRATRVSGKTSVTCRENVVGKFVTSYSSYVLSVGPAVDTTCEMTEQEKTFKTFCDGTRNPSCIYNSGHYTKLEKYAEV